MKKLLIFFALLVITISTTLTNAQAIQNTSTSGAKQEQHTKKDGTADKRFKENKSVKPVVIPTKKDGTPDMRYKASKKAAAKPTTKPNK